MAHKIPALAPASLLRAQAIVMRKRRAARLARIGEAFTEEANEVGALHGAEARNDFVMRRMFDLD